LSTIKQYSLPHLVKVTGVASLKTVVVASALPNSHIRYKPPVDRIYVNGPLLGPLLGPLVAPPEEVVVGEGLLIIRITTTATTTILTIAKHIIPIINPLFIYYNIFFSKTDFYYNIF